MKHKLALLAVFFTTLCCFPVEWARIPFVIDESGTILIHAVIGNTLGHFIFDTGDGTGIHITERIPEICKIDHTASVQLLGHTYLADFYNIIGGVYFFTGELTYSAPLTYIPESLHTYFKPGIKGIIASSIFSPFAVEISFSKNEIILHKDSIPEGYTSFADIIVSSNKAYVPISVDGKTIYALIDTGYNGKLSLPSDTLIKRELKISTQHVANNYSLVQAESISVFSVVSKNPILPKHRSEERIIVGGMNEPLQEPALIGVGLLRFYDVVLDLQNKRFYYRKRQDTSDIAKIFSQTLQTSGIISAKLNKDHIIVDEVIENSHAWNEGIRPAMKIIAINGKAVYEYYSDILTTVLRPLSKTSLTILVGATEKTIILETVSVF